MPEAPDPAAILPSRRAKGVVLITGATLTVARILTGNQLRLLVLPSYTEGLPSVMIESMACSTPFLTRPVGAVP